MKKSTIGVLGVGEVGKAIVEIFEKKFNVLKKDKDFDEIKKSKIEVLHICIPYTNYFSKIVVSQIKKNKPRLIIIHSTVIPGTTEIIFKKQQIPIVHSPIMGVHPSLARDILKFTKVIGAVNNNSAILAKNHLEKVGIKTILFKNPQESEFAKLLDTTNYAWNIIFSKIVYRLCKEKKLDFDNVYTIFNKIYNQGYKDSKPYVIRPVLKYYPGTIGGHCIIPNAKILNKYRKNTLTDLILKINDNFDLPSSDKK